MRKVIFFVLPIVLVLAAVGVATASKADFGVPFSAREGIKNAVKSDGSLRPLSVGEHQIKNEVIGCEKLAKYLRPRVCGKVLGVGPGAPGKDGAPGANGSDGAQGLQGALGATGDTGATGATGAKGYRGYRGYKGDKGDTGPRGYKGDPGKDGVDGKDGKDADNPDGGHWAPFCEIGNSIHPGLCPEDQDQKVQVYLWQKNDDPVLN